MKQPNVALIHDYLNQYGGAEKTLEAIMEIYPEAPVYTGIYNPKKLPDTITSKEIHALRNPLAVRFNKYFTFLMPLVFENFDLRKYDLIISDGTAWPKGVITSPQQLHISYIHTPPRFLYKYSVESSKRNKWFFKPFVMLIDHFLRTWDYSAAQRPDYLLTNSKETQARIKKFYNRDAVVINPPVEVNTKQDQPSGESITKPYYISLGRLVAYKNFDLLVEAFNMLELPLKIIGTGLEESRLKKLAGPNITFTGKVSEEEKSRLIEGSLGLVNPVKDEDFGIVPIEVMSHGKPVLAHKSGGHLEVIEENLNGMFFEELTVESLVKNIKIFDELIRNKAFNSDQIKMSVQKYSKDRFIKEFSDYANEKWNQHTSVIKSPHA